MTSKEIRNAVARNLTSKNGNYFEMYPLRTERILILHGLPEGPPCGICTDEWPSDSSFFDGLSLLGINQHYAFKRDGLEPGNHYTAFMVNEENIIPNFIINFLNFIEFFYSFCLSLA